ncbi:GNAT family N-acetyltransferase [Streptomyces cocklensis]|jgi:GNAT superfamily N-acetyltransferase|uniref:L-amino acid N-acyltransferase YncA n=1 Tax=Actinacidiphila cocklensis TaxID=887465 RepID=A0A9W4DYG7_9ACTN|nr:GNAT family N-acetyltransferase [Actinacidiphila cocklensis]MDD1061261.1 GNAT family N-acetyltransferase [Actinacidiphila cocklensis]WSX76899.1 GNAT family N-acetyltransferase [Streptomyces sp. NBC_00899]CAG6395820.1 L-amino acid N-acyltransferase YncA [Actinacidiphila cocklensis]
MIRPATPADLPVLHALIRELADYERALSEARATQEQLRTALFGPDPVAHALIATDEATGEPAGFALWFRNFSTWTGTAGLYLEDLYVRPQARGAGHGKALLAALAAICVERGWSRFEWTVLDWNEKALGVYRAIGARPQDEWTVQRLTGSALAALAAQTVQGGKGDVSAPGAVLTAGRSDNRTNSHAN